MQIVLADGSLLVAARSRRLADDKLAVDGETLRPLGDPARQGPGRGAGPAAVRCGSRSALEQIATAQGVEDQLVLHNGDVLRGVLKTVAAARRGRRRPARWSSPLRSRDAI